MTKDELEVKISTLQNLVTQKNDELTDYAAQIQRLNDELKDLNKPKLTPIQFDELREAVEEAVGQFDFDDADNYSFDFHIDYDNRIAIESLTFDNADEIVREVYDQVCELFAEQTAPEDDNQLNQD
tara:strand:+ start:62 stop:439 length:378 start_codon:yes stop_codon:yes gene_type:complete